MHMHATMWLIGCRPKALYFSHAQGRAPSKEIEDQKYGHTMSFSFPRDVHAEDTELNFISGKYQRHARGTAHIHSPPVKAEKRKQRVGKMRGTPRDHDCLAAPTCALFIVFVCVVSSQHDKSPLARMCKQDGHRRITQRCQRKGRPRRFEKADSFRSGAEEMGHLWKADHISPVNSSDRLRN